MNRASWRLLAVGAALAPALIVGGCGGGSPTPATSTPSPASSPSSTATPASSPTPSPPLSPTPALSPTPTPAPTPPAVDAFWEAVLRGLDEAGRLRVTVIGPSPGVLRYEPEASATVAEGTVVFICADGGAFDGQGGSFTPVPGFWDCGGPAFVSGFRRSGQPLDAWSDDLPTDDSIVETTALEPDGRWRWDYQARSAVFGGTVTATVWVDPVSGQIRDARRTDPTGDTRYGISYGETFPPIIPP